MKAPEHYSAYNERRDDEIDLRDIALAIYSGWKWIAASIIICVSLGAAYAFLIATPIYQTDISYSATPSGLDDLNSMPGTDYSESQAFAEFSQRLSSYENFRAFYETNPNAINSIIKDELDTESQARSFFFNSFSLSPSQEDEASRTFSLQYTEKTDGPQILNDYFRWTEDTYAKTLADRATRAVDDTIDRNKAKMDAHLRSHQDDIAARIARLQEEDKIKIAELEDRLEAEKQSLVSSREERIRVLEHAEQIASRLGIQKPTTPRDLGRQTQDRDVVYAEINSQGSLPLYFMGVEALSAEREVVEQNLEEDAKTPEIRNIESQLHQLRVNRIIGAIAERSNQTPFIDEYNNLRSENDILSANSVSPDEIDIVSAINLAYPPNGPESPKTSLIIALSLILGGMLGVFMVFVSRFITGMKDYKSNLQ